MSKRKKPTLTEKLASELLRRGDVPFEHAQQMTAAQICSLYQWHHSTLHAIEASNHPTVIGGMLIADHAERTPGDIKLAAKVKRITKAQEEFRARILAKDSGTALEYNAAKKYLWPARKMASRPFPKR